MAFTTATATDYHDLLDQLRLWLVGTVGWTQLEWTPPATITDTAQLHIRGPGAGAGRETFVNIQSRVDLGFPAYGWAVSGSTGFLSGPWSSGTGLPVCKGRRGYSRRRIGEPVRLSEKRGG